MARPRKYPPELLDRDARAASTGRSSLSGEEAPGVRGAGKALAAIASSSAMSLQEAESRRELARVVGRYARTELVCLDELGYLALPGRRRARLPSHHRAQRARLADRHHQPAVRRMDEGVPRPAPGLGRRRPDHAQGAHHRHRHRTLALPSRPRAPKPQTSMTPPQGNAPAAIATKPFALRAQAFATGVTALVAAGSR